MRPAICLRAWLCYLPILISGALQSEGHKTKGHSMVGINYGRIADNLPSPDEVVELLKASKVASVRIYDADPAVLKAFGNSGIQIVVGMENVEMVAVGADPNHAADWVKSNIQAFLPDTNVTGIAVGNEVYTGNDTVLMESVVAAMKNIHSALADLGLEDRIKVSTAHSLQVLSDSFPPSGSRFKPDLADHMKSLLEFLSETGAPVMMNAYPYFAYKDDPDHVSLDYVLFRRNDGVVDPNNNLHYNNMLYAQIDAVYAALSAAGYDGLEVIVSETGWPSLGDEEEAGASPYNAKVYNGNLMKRMQKREGTPLKPNVSVRAFIFALFNENLKPGPTSERNYGLFKPDGTEAYDVGLKGLKSVSSASVAGPPSYSYSYSYTSTSAKGKQTVIFFSVYLPVLSVCSFFTLLILVP